MTEREKRDAGLLYNAGSDPGLLEESRRAKELCHRYNQLSPADAEGQRDILRQLLGRMGENFHIYPPFWCDYGSNIELGEDFFANHGLVILDGAKVVFGDRVFIGPGCGIHTAGHPLDAERRNRWLAFNKPVRIGNDVWLGAGVQVLPGVSIGDGAVIGAGSVVTRDIPAGWLAFGNPCRVVRRIEGPDSKTI